MAVINVLLCVSILIQITYGVWDQDMIKKYEETMSKKFKSFEIMSDQEKNLEAEAKAYSDDVAKRFAEKYGDDPAKVPLKKYIMVLVGSSSSKAFYINKNTAVPVKDENVMTTGQKIGAKKSASNADVKKFVDAVVKASTQPDGNTIPIIFGNAIGHAARDINKANSVKDVMDFVVIGKDQKVKIYSGNSVYTNGNTKNGVALIEKIGTALDGKTSVYIKPRPNKAESAGPKGIKIDVSLAKGKAVAPTAAQAVCEVSGSAIRFYNRKGKVIGDGSDPKKKDGKYAYDVNSKYDEAGKRATEQAAEKMANIVIKAIEDDIAKLPQKYEVGALEVIQLGKIATITPAKSNKNGDKKQQQAQAPKQQPPGANYAGLKADAKATDTKSDSPPQQAQPAQKQPRQRAEKEKTRENVKTSPQQNANAPRAGATNHGANTVIKSARSGYDDYATYGNYRYEQDFEALLYEREMNEYLIARLKAAEKQIKLQQIVIEKKIKLKQKKKS